jgi:pyrroline-5-carboxylate reductase
MDILLIGLGKMGQAIYDRLNNINNLTITTVDAYNQAADTAIIPPRKFDAVILSVKPQQINEVLAQMQAQGTICDILFSIAAGIKIEHFIKSGVAENVCRLMPNLLFPYGGGITFADIRANNTASIDVVYHTILSVFGRVEPLNEMYFDEITAISGSGPAFVAKVLSDYIEAAQEALPHNIDLAKHVAITTFVDTAKVLTDDKNPYYKNPQKLITDVASKGGTTEAGLATMQTNALNQAILAATNRSKELSS